MIHLAICLYMKLVILHFILATTPVTTITERIPGIVNISRCYNHMFNCSLHPYSMATYCEVTVSSERMSITSNENVINDLCMLIFRI